MGIDGQVVSSWEEGAQGKAFWRRAWEPGQHPGRRVWARAGAERLAFEDAGGNSTQGSQTDGDAVLLPTLWTAHQGVASKPLIPLTGWGTTHLSCVLLGVSM